MGDYSKAFERFWKLYPRKKVKHAAWQKWQKYVKPLFEQEVIDALQAQSRRARMFRDEEKYIPHTVGRGWMSDGGKTRSRSGRRTAGQAAPEKGKYDDLF